MFGSLESTLILKKPEVWRFKIKLESFQFEINVRVFLKDITRRLYTPTLETCWS